MLSACYFGGIMAASSRPRRAPGRANKALPKKRGRRVAARRPRKAAKGAGQAAAPRSVEAGACPLAHEVRTPLTGILAISDLLATSDLAERERRWVDTIKAGAEHLASLATLFFDAARDRHGGIAIREDLFDLRAV